MRLRMKSKIVFLLLTSYFLLLTSLLPTSAYAKKQKIPQVGDLAPGFALYSLEGENKYIRLSKLCGKEVKKEGKSIL